MIKYGKLIGGNLYEAPSILIKDGKQYINPPKELYLEMGYLPIEYVEPPKFNDGKLISVCRWEQLEDRIIQVWVF